MLSQILYGFLFLICLCADRLTKWWAVTCLDGSTVNLTSNISFSLAWNPGISWGMLQFSNPLYFWLLTSVIALVIVIFGIYTFNQYRLGASIFFESVILSGAISNVIDRFWYGSVVDFIELHVHDWYWPSFNIADACIVGGVLGIIIKMGYDRHDDKH